MDNETIRSFLQLGQYLTIILGWIAFDYFAKKREKAKEQRDHARMLSKQTEELVSIAHDYHLSYNHDQKKCNDIKWKLKKIANSTRLLRENVGRPKKSNIIALRQSISTKNFETKKFQQQQQNSKLLMDITYAGLELLEEFEHIALGHTKDKKKKTR